MIFRFWDLQFSPGVRSPPDLRTKVKTFRFRCFQKIALFRKNA